MKQNDLRHGDVLLYVRKSPTRSLMIRTINFVTGSNFTHASVVQNVNERLVILEQLAVRTHSLLETYFLEQDEEVYVFRPKFKVPEFNRDLFKIRYYGYAAIIDCGINHLLARITFSKWQYKPMFAKFTSRMICSELVAYALDLKNNVKWCKYPSIIEPDDYSEHSEDFELVGTIEEFTV